MREPNIMVNKYRRLKCDGYVACIRETCMARGKYHCSLKLKWVLQKYDVTMFKAQMRQIIPSVLHSYSFYRKNGSLAVNIQTMEENYIE